MRGLAHLEVGRATDRRARVDQVGGVQHAGAVLALVAARPVVAAVRARALDVAVGQEPAVDRRVHLPDGALLDEAVLVEAPREVLRDLGVLRGRAAAEVVERQPEAVVDRLLGLVCLRAELGDGLAGLRGGELSRCAVLVRGADVQHLVAPLTQVPRVDIGREHRPDHVPQVLDAVDVRKRTGDKVASHRWMLQFVRTGKPVPNPRATGPAHYAGGCGGRVTPLRREGGGRGQPTAGSISSAQSRKLSMMSRRRSTPTS